MRVTRTEIHGKIALTIAVSDTGIGIPTDKIPLLFQPFTQADQSIVRDYGGTGLGLLIAKELTELMQGKISVSSVVGIGSTFTVTIPLTEANPPATQTPEPTPDLTQLQVVIIAAHAAARRHLQQKLAWSNIRASAVDSVAAALEKLHQAQMAHASCQAIIVNSDLVPAAYETLFEQLQNLPSSPKIIMLNPLAGKGDAAQFRTHPGLICLDKPLRHNEPAATLATACLPTTTAQPPLSTIQSTTPAPDIDNPSKAAHIHVLLAEDVVPNQLLAVALLKKMGIHTDVVNNGLEALQALQKKEYALVLMDVQMPVMDGFAAVHAIRNPESAVPNHAIPVIAMTAHAMEGDRERCLHEGMDDYLSKPITPKQLYDTLKQWLPLTPR